MSDIKWEKAKDWYVWDQDGRRYIDFTSGIFVANVGHANDAVKHAVENVLFYHSYTYETDLKAEYIQRMLKLNPAYDACALFCSGSEAVEAALRIMRGHDHKRQKVIYLHGNFHGRTLGASMQTHSLLIPWPSDPTTRWSHIAFDSISSINNFLRKQTDICGIILESYRGWDARFYPQDFIDSVHQLCQDHDLLLCFDEVQAGFARTGCFWGYEHYNAEPDLVCFGKAAGGGVPLSGVLGLQKLFENVELTSTHGGHPLGCAAGPAVLDEIDKRNLIAETARKGSIMHQKLRSLKIDTQGRGLVGSLLLRDIWQADEVVRKCAELGLLVVHTGRRSVKLGPPLIISDEDLRQGLEIIKEVVDHVC